MTQVVVPFVDRYVKDEDRKKVAAKALKPFETEGWKGDESDLFNGHRRAIGGQTVTFRRHVDVEGNPIER